MSGRPARPGTPHTPEPLDRMESPDATLAKNLVVARAVTGVTQHALAAAADVSRATIAQIETGYSDPRLSTIVELAHALGVPPTVLLVREQDVRAMADRLRASAAAPFAVPEADVERMRRLLATGLLKDRVRAGRLGALAARRAGYDAPAALACAAICSALLPGEGTVVGTLLGSKTE